MYELTLHSCRHKMSVIRCQGWKQGNRAQVKDGLGTGCLYSPQARLWQKTELTANQISLCPKTAHREFPEEMFQW